MLMIGRRKHEELFIVGPDYTDARRERDLNQQGRTEIKVKVLGIGVPQTRKGEPIYPINLDESMNDKFNFSVILGIHCPRELKIYRDVLYKDRY